MKKVTRDHVAPEKESNAKIQDFQPSEDVQDEQIQSIVHPHKAEKHVESKAKDRHLSTASFSIKHEENQHNSSQKKEKPVSKDYLCKIQFKAARIHSWYTTHMNSMGD